MNKPRDSSVFVCIEDLRGEGIGSVLDRVVDGYGCTGVTVAAAYHQARDVTPHGSTRVTVRHDGVHFEPEPELFAGLRLQPPVRAGAHDQPLRSLRKATTERGVALHGWTVFCHNTTLGTAQPGCTTENVFGDRAAPADLCPSHPDVQAYALALARNVARHGVDTVVAEALHFGTFNHGYHHERSFVPLGELDAFLLGLCYCAACMRSARQHGVDAEAARTACRKFLDRVLAGGPSCPYEPAADVLAAEVGVAVAGYAMARTATVTTLATRVADAVADEGSQLVFLDAMGAVKGYATGAPTGAPASEEAWHIGIDPRALAQHVPAYAILAYARDPARVAADVAAYRLQLGPHVALRVVLRPCLPDTDSAGHLAQKASAARREGATALDFYHYGLAPLPALDRIPAALDGR
jgi:hypothetical protein